MAEPRLVVAISDPGSPGYRLTWYFPDEEDMGGSIGEAVYTANNLKEVDAGDVDCVIAYLAIKQMDGVKRDSCGFYWKTRAAANAALKIVKAAIKAGVDRPLPDWAQKALAAGWQAPKGWKP